MQTIDKETSIKYIKDILYHKDLTRLQLSSMIGRKNPQWIADIFNLKRPEVRISKNIAMSLHRVFPDLNIDALLTGEGELFQKNDASYANNESNSTYNENHHNEMRSLNKEKSIEYIGELLNHTGLTRMELSKKIGKSNAQWIADIYSSSKKGGISSNTAYALSRAFPELNLDTLLSGEGELFKSFPEPEKEEKADPAPQYLMTSEKNSLDNCLSIIKDLVSQNTKHADANLKNAEANKMHADNIRQLISFLGSDKKKEYDDDGKPLLRDIP